VRALYVIGGVAQILIGAGGFFIPAIMQLEENNNGHAATTEATVADAVPANVG
jgi:hypothetical protein